MYIVCTSISIMSDHYTNMPCLPSSLLQIFMFVSYRECLHSGTTYEIWI